MVKNFIFVTIISLTFSFTTFSKDLLSLNKFKDEIVYWQDLLSEELITDTDFTNKKKELLDSISKIKVYNNLELKEKLIAWNTFFKDLYNNNIINEEEYNLKINESTKYIVPNFKIKNKTDLKEQLKFWKNIFEEKIVSKKQYENEKSQLLNTKISEEVKKNKFVLYCKDKTGKVFHRDTSLYDSCGSMEEISKKEYNSTKSTKKDEIVTSNNNLKINTHKKQKLEDLERLLEDELITNEEFQIKRRQILDQPNISYIEDFTCIKNYTNKLNKKNIDKVMCFCLNKFSKNNVKFTVDYVITRSTAQVNICQNKKAISYRYYLNNGGHEFHNNNSIGVNKKIVISKEEEDIESWKNKVLKEKNQIYSPRKLERSRCYRDRNMKLNCDRLPRQSNCIMVQDRNKNMVCKCELTNTCGQEFRFLN